MHERLSQLIQEKNITQRELANKTGMTECTISRYCSGERTPHADNLRRIAKALDVSSDYLLGLSDEQTYGVNKLVEELRNKRKKYYEFAFFHNEHNDKDLEEKCYKKAMAIEKTLDVLGVGVK